MQISMTVNGNEVTSDIEPRVLLVHYIREVLAASLVSGFSWRSASVMAAHLPMLAPSSDA